MEFKDVLKTVDVDNGRIHYSACGKKPRLAFIHNYGTNHTIFRGVRQELAEEGYSSLALDNRGHGHSLEFEEGYPGETFFKLDDLVKDLERVREAEGSKKLTVVGYDEGSLIAQRYAAEHPENVDALVLVSPRLKGRRMQLRTPKSLLNLATGFANKLVFRNREGYYPDYSEQRFVNKSLLSRGLELYAYHDTKSGHALLSFLKASGKWDTTQDAEKIEAPTLLVHGYNGRYQSAAHKLAGKITNAGDPVFIHFSDDQLPIRSGTLASVILSYLNNKPQPRKGSPRTTKTKPKTARKGKNTLKKAEPAAKPTSSDPDDNLSRLKKLVGDRSKFQPLYDPSITGDPVSELSKYNESINNGPDKKPETVQTSGSSNLQTHGDYPFRFTGTIEGRASGDLEIKLVPHNPKTPISPENILSDAQPNISGLSSDELEID